MGVEVGGPGALATDATDATEGYDSLGGPLLCFGFLVKDTRPAELLDAIRTAAAGEALLSPGPTARLIARFLRSPTVPPVGGPEQLSGREREVLALVGRGLTDSETAGALGLSPLTAKTHVSRIMGKPGTRDRAQLVVAYESGVVTPGTM